MRLRESDPITKSLSDIPLSTATISSHFILNTIFKLETVKSSYLFIIVDATNSEIQLGLYFSPASTNIIRITLFSAALLENNITFTSSISYTEWTKLLLDVNEGTATLYINCEITDEQNYNRKLENFTFTKDAKLHLGHGGSVRKGYFTVS